MRCSLLVLAAAALVSPARAITLGPRTSNPRTVGLEIARSHSGRSAVADQDRVEKRQKVVSEILDNELTLYYADVTVGTPPQSLRLHIDTGSSDMWCNIANSTLCSSASGACQGGTYDPTSSSSYRYVSDQFNISYVDGSASNGDYVTDTFHIASETLANFQFGIGFQSSSQEGVLGVGYTANEVQVNRAGSTAYSNLPQALVDAGLINTNAYSLWLNDLDANTGTVLFGGVDTAKHHGNLATVPVIPVYGSYLAFIIALTGMSVDGTDLSSSSSLPSPVLLDSGATLSYLPSDLVTDVYNKVNAVYDSDSGAAYVACSMKDLDSQVDFTFSGQTISVPFNELVLEQGVDARGQGTTFQNGTPACVFGIAPAPSSTLVLGDSFLRSAYVVYDLEKNEISLAQTNFNATGSDIKEITRSSGVPGATAVSNPVTTLAAGNGGARNGGPTLTVGSSPTGLTNGAYATKHFSATLLALMVVGAAFVML